ncbi:putative MarR family transcriptional regulator [Gordonia araii NBRC 100433]|uniref:Putative MarR family transcriptional regulator n=1 Tax=Gordonia araii NBRC 100433 TaxID=1073574 RepID=G7H3Z7_9ACTN|nr:MarR family transcriptional regulator [Gordonia araii]NNG96363.1 MarR family transcriptional regulator [Gordonia araii NBRC 100433]GAB10572.1 putative MarR family transcriptional regulator [Gordonia araii NBRC 100433]
MATPLDSLPTWILSTAASRSHHVLQRRLGAAGCTGYEYRCLAGLAAAGDPLSQAELGSAAALDPRDVTHTVRALENRGLVARDKDPEHGRRMLVSLTAAGRRAAAELASVMAGVQEDVFARLTADERDILVALLVRVG